jgi:hypothetical protein
MKTEWAGTGLCYVQSGVVLRISDRVGVHIKTGRAGEGCRFGPAQVYGREK